jgi:tRNA threonylcarbamoyladenosine biosynthesis protein TsaB
MANILLIETATEVCSAALSVDGKVVSCRENREGFRHSELLTVFTGELLDEAGMKPHQLDAVCVSKGPGSYTGLRIGVSAAKGICYALGIPIIGVSTLDSLALYISRQLTPDHPAEKTLLCPMLDARRMEVYTALYNHAGQAVTGISAQIIHENSFEAAFSENKVLFFGNGASKCKAVIKSPNACFIEDIHASARFMTEIAEDCYNKKRWENVAYFEPFYLKDFVPTVPKNKVF